MSHIPPRLRMTPLQKDNIITSPRHPHSSSASLKLGEKRFLDEIKQMTAESQFERDRLRRNGIEARDFQTEAEEEREPVHTGPVSERHNVLADGENKGVRARAVSESQQGCLIGIREAIEESGADDGAKAQLLRRLNAMEREVKTMQHASLHEAQETAQELPTEFREGEPTEPSATK